MLKAADVKSSRFKGLYACWPIAVAGQPSIKIRACDKRSTFCITRLYEGRAFGAIQLLGNRFFNLSVLSPPLGPGWRGFRGRKGKMGLISRHPARNRVLLSIGFRESSDGQSENRAFRSNLGTRERPGSIFESGPALSGGTGSLNPSEKQGRHPAGRGRQLRDLGCSLRRIRTRVPATRVRAYR